MIIFNYENLVDSLLRDIRKFTPDFAGMKVGDRVLDVCCGTGEQVFEYGRSGITATGIDIDPNLLKIALKNMAKNNLKNVSYQQADATNLPFSDFHFDCASIECPLMVTEQPSDRKESARPSPIPLVLPVITMLFIIQLQTQFYK